jgi:AraC-like DNA-binding protein
MKNTPSITQLQEHWHRLSDLERARAVQAIISRSGLSIRKIAAQLHLSESLLRHLLQASIARRPRSIAIKRLA